MKQVTIHTFTVISSHRPQPVFLAFLGFIFTNTHTHTYIHRQTYIYTDTLTYTHTHTHTHMHGCMLNISYKKRFKD